jgi:hypothetical protein
MMFELLVYVMDRFLNLRDTDTKRAIALDRILDQRLEGAGNAPAV